MIHPIKETSKDFLYRCAETTSSWKKSALVALSSLSDRTHTHTSTQPKQTIKASSAMAAQIGSQARIHPFPIYSETDKSHIAELLKIFDDSSIIGLSIKIYRLAELGDKIGHLHPFTFIYIVMTDPLLKSRMRRIYDSSIKRHGMMNRNFLREGFGNKMDRELKKGTLDPYIEAFANSLNLPVETIRPMIQEAAWTDLCSYLLEKTSLPEERSFQG